MALALTAGPTDELLSVEDAKRHLRILNSDLDSEVASKVRSARDYCERLTQRTLRKTVTRTEKLCKWWCRDIKLPWPPLIGVTSITYYDSDNASQTLSTDNYQVETSTEGGGRVVWTSTATIPATYDRADAITITFTTGYTSIDPTVAVNPLPPVALEAMKLAVDLFWGDLSESEYKATERSINNLLGTIDWTGYA